MSAVLDAAAEAVTSPAAGKTRPYADPYLCGVGIGLVLLAAYLLVGRGLGASGAFASAAAAGVAAVEGTTAATSNPALAPYLEQGVSSPFRDWLVLEIVGVVAGAFASAWRAGRLRPRSDTQAIAPRARLGLALSGGLLMGAGARLAHGCTSGLALTGGALLSVGAWVFIATCFAAGFLGAPLLRRAWS